MRTGGTRQRLAYDPWRAATRHRWVLAAGLIALGALGAGRLLVHGATPRGSGTMRRSLTARELLQPCRARLTAARAEVARHPGDGRAHLRLAILELRHAFLLALVASETVSDPTAADARRQEFVRR